MIKRLLLILLLFASINSYGSHIVGGEFEMTYLCPNTYGLRLILYFDELNGFEELQNQDVYAHIFRKRDNELMQVVFLPKLGQIEIPYYQEWCDDNEVQTLRIIYGDTITLADSIYYDPEGYYVAWENCCRNYSVTNVITGVPPMPGTDPFSAEYSGQTYYLEFPAVIKDGKPFINSTPSSFPPLNSYACPNVEYWANFAGRDPDGDSLVYTLVSPLDNLPEREQKVTRPGPYPEVNWVEGFGPSNFMNGDPKLSITTDGFLSVTPQVVGLFVFAVRVDEWRNGEKIGVIQREFQLYVDDLCEPTFPPEIQSKKGSETTYSDVDLLSVSFSNNISDSDRCINLLVSDKDAEDSVESIVIHAIPLNFNDEDSLLNDILPEETELELSNGSTASFDICFPECPFIDPEIYDTFIIGILVYDDSCPLPLIDTLRLEVQIEPPVNQNPYILVDGVASDPHVKIVTESAGGFISFPIEGIDPDNQDLSMEIIPSFNFDPLKAGITFSAPEYQPGSARSLVSWDFDCTNESLDYSEGLDVSMNQEVTRKQYEFLIIVEDQDDCEFSRADTVKMDLIIEFPGEAHPNVFIPGEDVNQDYFAFDYDISETINLDIKALDGPFDNDLLNLSAIGVNYAMESYGASFPEVNGGSGQEPGTFSIFTWPLLCNKLKVNEQDTFRTQFIVTDIDICNLANSDTLTVDFILHLGENTDPDLWIENIVGEEQVINDTLITNISKRVRFNLVGSDPDSDSLELRLLHVNGARSPDEFTFDAVKGKGMITTTFSMDLNCELLKEDFSESRYEFAFLLEDLNCARAGTDTLSFNLIISDTPVDDSGFLPANIFTPNGDGNNDFFGMSSYDELRDDRFILPLDNCLGKFRSVTIINRYGIEVFFSTDRNFKWFAEGMPSGVYFYMIRYTNKVYKGNVTVIF